MEAAISREPVFSLAVDNTRLNDGITTAVMSAKSIKTTSSSRRLKPAWF
jgi:hypothetical protein